jgi:hypothetical protein
MEKAAAKTNCSILSLVDIRYSIIQLKNEKNFEKRSGHHIFRSRMARMTASPEAMTDDYVIRIIIIHPVWLKAIVPCVVVGRKIIRRQRAGIGAVGGRRVRLVKIPVARCKRSSDQHKLNAGGLFHNGVARLTAIIKIH